MSPISSTPTARTAPSATSARLCAKHLDRNQSRLYDLLDPGSSNSPLNRLKRDVVQEIEAVTEVVQTLCREVAEQAAAAKARAEERERGTAKGLEYEEGPLLEAIAEIAGVFGDTPEFVGHTPGPTGKKAGDIVVTLNPDETVGAPLRMAFEAKDGPVGASKILGELEAAKENREATVAMAVYSRDEYAPTGWAPFQDCGRRVYAYVYDKDELDPLALKLAYRAARTEILSALEQAGGEVDVAALREDLEEGQKLLNVFSSVKGSLTKLDNSVTEQLNAIRTRLNELKAGLEGVLDRIDTRIHMGSE